MTLCIGCLPKPELRQRLSAFGHGSGRDDSRVVGGLQRLEHVGRGRRATPTVSPVIPVRNEARNIAWVLEQIADVHEIVLVDGNSTDATQITARRYCPDISVVAFRTGFLAATDRGCGGRTA